jgi:hypothetical protein
MTLGCDVFYQFVLYPRRFELATLACVDMDHPRSPERGVEASEFVIPIGKTAETGDEYLTSHPKEREKTRTDGT